MRAAPSCRWCHVVMLRRRTRTAAATVLAVLAGAPAALASSVDYGPISHKGFKTVGAASTSLKLAAADRLRREPVGPAERGQVREQPGLFLLRQVPVTVDAAEQVRRLVLQAQVGRQHVQVQRGHGDGRRHPPARERDGQRRQGAEDVRDEVEGLQDQLGLEGGAAGEHAEAAEGDQGQRRHGRRDAPADLRRQLVGRRGPPSSPTAGRRRGPGRRTSAASRRTFPAALASGSGLYPNQILRPTGSHRCTRRACRARASGSRSWARPRRRPPT